MARKLETYQTWLGFFDPAITSVDEGGAGSRPGPRALRLPAKFHWLRAGFQIFATKLGDTSAAQLEAIVTRYSLDELRQRYVIEGRPLKASLEEILRADTRAGARAILASIEKRHFENRSEGQRLRKMLRFETLLWDEGQDAVAGVDEAGMSPLAGPVCAAAVILKPGTRITGIDDSKKLDANSREALAEEIKEKAASWYVAFVEVEEIDAINIYWAGILAMRRAVESPAASPDRRETLERDSDPAAGDYQGRREIGQYRGCFHSGEGLARWVDASARHAASRLRLRRPQGLSCSRSLQ